jgi:hypothetical protein
MLAKRCIFAAECEHCAVFCFTLVSTQLIILFTNKIIKNYEKLQQNQWLKPAAIYQPFRGTS